MSRETTAMACERQRIDFRVTVLSAAGVRRRFSFEAGAETRAASWSLGTVHFRARSPLAEPRIRPTRGAHRVARCKS